jgi:hypothetical protein
MIFFLCWSIGLAKKALIVASVPEFTEFAFLQAHVDTQLNKSQKPTEGPRK